MFPKYWYDVRRADEIGYVAADVYLSEQIGQTLADEFVLRSTGSDFTVLKVTAEVVAAVTINREVEEPFTTQNVKLVPQALGGFASTLTSAVGKQTITGHVSGTVTAIQVSDQDGPVPRNEHPLPADWLTDWAVEVPLAATEPNPEPLGESLDLPGLLPALTPGRPLVFSDRAEQVAQVVDDPTRRAGRGERPDPHLVGAGDADAGRGLAPGRPEGLRQRRARLARPDRGGDGRRIGWRLGVPALRARRGAADRPAGRGRRRARARGARRRRPVDARPGLRRQRSRRPPLSQRHRRGAA